MKTRVISPKTNSYQIKPPYFGCARKEGGPVIAETDLLFMKISLISIKSSEKFRKIDF